jgi:hypothetical protein
MKFKKEDLQELVYEERVEDIEDPIEIVENKIIDTSRWTNSYELIFKTDSGKFYKTSYSVGATEYQDVGAFEFEPDEIKCTEVFPVEQTVIVYKKAKT